MNKIFILVHREPYEGDTIYGVYTTKEKAEAALRDFDQRIPHHSEYHLILAVYPDEKPDDLCAEAVG